MFVAFTPAHKRPDLQKPPIFRVKTHLHRGWPKRTVTFRTIIRSFPAWRVAAPSGPLAGFVHWRFPVVGVVRHHSSADTGSPLVQAFFELLSFFGHPLGEVVLLAGVVSQIEQLHAAVLEIFEQLKIALTDGPAGALHPMVAVMREMPEEGFTVEMVFAFQQGH